MAKKGLSKLIIAKYSHSDGTTTYSEGNIPEKMSEYSLDITTTDNNNLYLDNEIAESEGGEFKEGTLAITTGELMPATSKLLLSIKENKITVGGESVTEYVFDDNTKSIEVGCGLIELHQNNNEEFYRAIWLNRVKFNIPGGSAKTKEDTVDWQLPEITGSVMRDAAGDHAWQCYADLPDEAKAVAYLKQKANIVA